MAGELAYKTTLSGGSLRWRIAVAGIALLTVRAKLAGSNENPVEALRYEYNKLYKKEYFKK
jgi:hypothetical protein